MGRPENPTPTQYPAHNNLPGCYGITSIHAARISTPTFRCGLQTSYLFRVTRPSTSFNKAFSRENMNQKYMPSSSFISSQPVPQALPLRMHRHAPSVSELQEHPGKAIPSPLSSHDRGYVGRQVRTGYVNPEYGPLPPFFMIEQLIYSAVYPIVAVPQRCPAQSILTIRPVL